MEVLYEAKVEVPIGSEGSMARRLKLRFIGEHNTVDYYLKTEEGKTTKDRGRQDD